MFENFSIRHLSLVLCGIALLGALFFNKSSIAGNTYGEKSCCKTSTCTSAILLTASGNNWTEGCSKDAAGVCSGECYRCTGASSSADVCYYQETGECYSTEMAWQTYSCGKKDKYRCKRARSQDLWVKLISKSVVACCECAGRWGLSLSHSAQSRSQRSATASEAHRRNFGLEP